MRGHEGLVSHISDTQYKDRYGKRDWFWGLILKTQTNKFEFESDKWYSHDSSLNWIDTFPGSSFAYTMTVKRSVILKRCISKESNIE